MASLETEELIYISWTEESSSVFIASFDEELWNMILEEAHTIYGKEHSKRPTRFSTKSKEIKAKFKEYKENFTRFICEVPSAKGTASALSQTTLQTPYVFSASFCEETSSCDDIEILATEIKGAIRESYQICRKKASEVLVWLLSDTDRLFHPEIPHSLPVAYAMKGYSLSTPIMRAMHEDILQKCYDKGIDVACSCFDGQWLKMATRSRDDKPLTLLQLQRDVWDKSKKESRDTIISYISKTNIIKNIDSDIILRKDEIRVITVSCSLLQKVLMAIAKQHAHKPDKEGEHRESQDNADILSTLPEDALDALMVGDDISSDIINDLGQKTATEVISGINDQEDESVMEDIDDEIDLLNECSGIDMTDQIPVGHESDNRAKNHTQVQHGDDVVDIMDKDMLDKTPVPDEVYKQILNSFKSHQKKSVAKRWENKDINDVKTTIGNSLYLKKLTHDEINVVMEATIPQQKNVGIIIRKSWKIQEKCNGISRVIGDGLVIEEERKIKHMLSLKEFATRKIRKNRVSKNLLNIIYAVLKFPEAFREWSLASPFTGDIGIQDIGTIEWFSYPEYSSERQKLEPKCVDAHHLLVNLRVKVCKDGLRGIRKKAWHDVAERDRNVISKALVFDLIDKQNNSFAQRTFSNEVESSMRVLGYTEEAEFCQLVREWYEAEDAPGITAVERTCRRLKIKSFIMREVDFGMFPPYGMYVNGFTRASFEGFLQKIDTNIQLYSVIKSGTYNQRAISSLVNETFFGELSDMDVTRLGCPKAVNIPRLISTVTEIHHYRRDPSDR